MSSIYVATVAPELDDAEHANGANGATARDHVVVLTPDTEPSVQTLGCLGLEPRRTRDMRTDRDPPCSPTGASPRCGPGTSA